MSRVFLMKWYHFSVEYFEDLRNVNHCEFLIMKKQLDSGKYDLENKLRTWSELRRERAALKAKEDKEFAETGKERPKKLERMDTATPAAPRKWGGCPEGCNHGKNFKIRRDLAELLQHDEHSANDFTKEQQQHHHQHQHQHQHQHPGGANGTIASRRTPAKKVQGPNNSDDDSDDPRGAVPPQIDVTKAQEDVVSSPDGTPSFITIEDRLRNALKTPQKSSFLLHTGRDFGGTYSGHASEEEFSENDARERLAARAARVKNGLAANGGVNVSGREPSTTRGHAHANRLGDAPNNSDQGSDGDNEAEDLDKAEREDRSVRGSVY